MKNRKTSSNNKYRNLAAVAFTLACANATGAWAQGAILSEPAPDSTLPPEVVPVDPNSMPQNSANFAAGGMNGQTGAAVQISQDMRNAGQMPVQSNMQNMSQAQPSNTGMSPYMQPGQGLSNNNSAQPISGTVSYQQSRPRVSGAAVANTVSTLSRLVGPALLMSTMMSRRPSYPVYGYGMGGFGGYPGMGMFRF